ncbi:probable strigolactone esterase DAD2 [Diospyros lotus]|uniref:probable strigolactone esterase DAD2 n=1 Tax=Diospyros lotus TaxID=55363 RepID=UPI0022560551|nr:probable strigolactone esterase DAD2 [Diospyros lotus]
MAMLGKALSAAMNARTVGSGAGETIVLVHGFGADQSVWDKILPDLAQRHRVVLFDWSFSGAVKDPSLFDPAKYSSYDAFADDLISLMEEMNLHRSSSVFVGHSMSAMIGCIASIKRPELFKRLILIGASPRYINSEDYEGGFDSTEVDKFLSSIETNFLEWASGFASLIVNSPDDPLSVAKYRDCLQSMSPEAALAVAGVVFRCDHRDMLENVVVPCTIITMPDDAAVPDSVAGYLQNKIKAESTVEIIETPGHFPMLTAPLRLLEVLAGALASDL